MVLLFSHACKNVSEQNRTRGLSVPNAEINQVLYYNTLVKALDLYRMSKRYHMYKGCILAVNIKSALIYQYKS